ncbi:MAG: hypothetical protein GX452_10220 [Ignavibacteriales bacterium]|jgi:hypothetical protein|nr:hypothetical protein [Ignavibacteriales bacterium]
MKNILLIIFLLFLTFGAAAQNINGRISSSVYSFERFETEQISNTYYRAYQMLNLNINKDRFSLRTFMNLEDDFTKKLEYDPRLRVYSLFLEARDLFDVATVKLGRQPIYNSVTGGTFDGGLLALKYDDYRLTGYYGANTPAYQKLGIIENFSENMIAGADFYADLPYNMTLGLSYVNKNFKTQDYNALRMDDDLNPINLLIRAKSLQYQFASAKLGYSLPELIDVNLRYDFDMNIWSTSKLELTTEYKATSKINLDLYYNYREPRVRYNSIFSVFDYGNTQEIEIGGGYRLLKDLTATARFGYVKYADENSSRLNVGVTSKYGSLSYRKTFGYAGELDAVSLYSGYTFFDGLLTPSVGLSYTTYKLISSAEKNDLMTLLAGVNIRPYRVLSADLQAQYMNNKIYKNDFRLLFRVNYWFNTNLSLL